jgi:hypothetical protein
VTSKFNENRIPDELQDVVERLRKERPQASAMELDPDQAVSDGKGRFMKSRLVSLMLVTGVLAGGAGAMAVTGVVPQQPNSPPANVRSQYCPPKSHQPGKPKKPRPARCGKGPKPPRCRMIVPDQVEPVILPEQFAGTEGGETAAVCSPAITE